MQNFSYSNINESKIWIEDTMAVFNSKKIIRIENYKEFFKNIKKTLLHGDFHDKYKAIVICDKILHHYFLNQSTEFDFINAFNSVIEDLILFIGESNVYNNIAEKVFAQYIKHHDNVEFLIKFILTQGLGNRDWKIRFNCLILLNMLLKDKHSFFVEKKTYTIKVIESLILHSKDKAVKLSNFSAQLLIDFISNLPNYNEINLILPVEALTDIEKIISNERTNSLNVIRQSIAVFKNNLSQKGHNIKSNKIKQISENFGFENQMSEFNLNNLSRETNLSLNEFFSKIRGKMDYNGVLFGVFPTNLIETTDPDLSFDIRSMSFERIKSIFMDNFMEESFIAFCPAFFNFLVNFVNDSFTNICLISLELIDKIIGKVPGIDLLVNLMIIIPKLADTFSRLNASVTECIKEIFNKLMMILPTSKLLPHLLKFLEHPNWVVISDSLDVLHTMFDTLPSIYNDIDFENGEFDINLLLPILSCLRHPVPKIVSRTKKIIMILLEKVVNKIDFLKSIKLVVSESLYEEISILAKTEQIAISHKRGVDKSNYISKMIQERRTKINETYKNTFIKKDLHQPLLEINKNIEIDPDEIIDEEKKDDNLKIFKRIAKYEALNENDDNEIPINVDENSLNTRSSYSTKNHFNNKIDIIIQNYSNYKAKSPKVKEIINKSRLKRYNDPEDHELETKYDTSYNFEVKERETLSPLKSPETVYFKIYDLLRSNLNWEKQFKALDYLRKILYYNSNMIFKDTYYFSLIIDEIVSLLSNLRTSLVRNSLLSLNEIFHIKEAPIISKYEIILKSLIKKVLDKNEFISSESNKVLDIFVQNCEVSKAINILLSITQNNYKNLELVKICIKLWIYFIKIHKKEVVKTRVFVGLMRIVIQAFNNSDGLKRDIKEFFKEMERYYESRDKFITFIRKYFSEESYEKIIIWVSQ